MSSKAFVFYISRSCGFYLIVFCFIFHTGRASIFVLYSKPKGSPSSFWRAANSFSSTTWLNPTFTRWQIWWNKEEKRVSWYYIAKMISQIYLCYCVYIFCLIIPKKDIQHTKYLHCSVWRNYNARFFCQVYTVYWNIYWYQRTDIRPFSWCCQKIVLLCII